MLIEVISSEKTKNVWITTVKKHNFYIDGKGGQLGDTGYIDEIKVLSVLDDNKIITEKHLAIGNYNYSIDKKRVQDIAEQHTAQHLFSAVAYNQYNFNTVGFRMTEKYSTVDLDSVLNEITIQKIEDEVNKNIKIGSNINIKLIPYKNKNDLKGLRKTISDKIKEDIRVVEIENLDINACAGYHVKNLIELRLFKIINFEKIKGKYTRLYFLSGERALEDYISKHNIVKKLNTIYSCKDNEILNMNKKFSLEKKMLDQKYKNILHNYCEVLSKDIINTSILKNNKKYIIFKNEPEIINILAKFVPKQYSFIGLTDEGGIICSNIVNCLELFNKISNLYDVKGGGKENRINFKGKLTEQEIIKIL